MLLVQANPYFTDAGNACAKMNLVFSWLEAFMLIFLMPNFSSNPFTNELCNVVFVSIIMAQLAANFLFSVQEFIMMLKAAIEKKN